MPLIARFVLGFTLLLAGAARAGDVIPFAFGAPVPLDAVRARNVALESEKFRAQIFYDYATATATYRFRNGGAATMVAMAFPGDLPRDSDDESKSSFKVRVDGKSVRFRRETKGKGFSAVTRYLGRVRFEGGQSRTMQVEIRTAKFWSYGFDADLEYAFADPKWAGQTRSGIGISVRAPGAFIVNAFGGTADYFEKKDAVAFRSRGGNCWLKSDQELKGRALFSLVATFSPDWLTREGQFSPLEKTIVVPGPARGFYSAGFWLPDALVKSGVTYVRLDRLVDYEAKGKDRGVMNWDESTNRVTLRRNGHALSVTQGRLDARVDERNFRLRAKPFVVEESGHDVGSQDVIFVPLTDVVKALGGTFAVDQKAHKFSTSLLKSEPTEGD